MKKNIIRILILLILVTLIGGGYFFLRPYLGSTPAVTTDEPTPIQTDDFTFENEPFVVTTSTSQAPESTSPTNVIAAPERGEVGVILDRPLYDYWLETATRAIYAVSRDGQILRVTGNTEEAIFSFDPESFVSVHPNPEGTMAIFAHENDGVVLFDLLDLVNGAQVARLPEETFSARWNTNGEDIAVALSPTTRSQGELARFNPQSQSLSRIINAPFFTGSIILFSGDTILFSEPPSQEVESALWEVSVGGRTIQPVLTELPGLLVAARGDVPYFVVSSSDLEYLTLYDRDGGSETPLFYEGLASKCIPLPEEVLCATPYYFPQPTNAPDNYLQRAIYTQDSIRSFPLADVAMSQELYNGATSEVKFDAHKLNVIGDVLYFINRYDNALYGLSL